MADIGSVLESGFQGLTGPMVAKVQQAARDQVREELQPVKYGLTALGVVGTMVGLYLWYRQVSE
mgnify:CR=1 FL=1